MSGVHASALSLLRRQSGIPRLGKGGGKNLGTRLFGKLALAGMLTAAGGVMAQANTSQSLPAGVQLAPLAYAAVPGWAADDHAAAFRAFLATCRPLVSGAKPVRGGVSPSGGLIAACRAAVKTPSLDRAGAKRFFEAHFKAFSVDVPGFVTGYFEPEITGSARPTSRHSAPLLSRPAQLPSPAPDRAAIEDGALQHATRPLVYLDPVDLFMTHVQGSVRVRMLDGTDAGKSVRLGYAGRNGLPYTSAAKLLVEKLGVPPSEMTADKLYGWLKANPAEGREIMRQNKSYIFFRRADELKPGGGPVGAAGVQLLPMRSLAVDRKIWSYGLPVFVSTTLPANDGSRSPFNRLLVAQDTGTAIVGAARGDIFVGSGAEAGHQAGLLRDPARFIVLLPDASPATAAPSAR